ncbi:MAG: HAD-IB family phosphatase [Blastocatellia bacterium]
MRSQPHIFCDFDGTITAKDTLVFLSTRLGAGPDFVRAIGEALREDRITLREAIADEMRTVRLSFEQAAEILLREIPLDPGFDELVRWSQRRAVPFTILSAGFHELIRLFVPAETYPWVRVLANNIEADPVRGWQCRFRDEGPFGHDKRQTLRAAMSQGEYAIFIGDGFSDRQAAEIADEVFAKHSLTDYCRERRIDFHEYQTLVDVQRKLQDLL